MIISSLDKEYTQKQERALKRFEKEEERKKKSVPPTVESMSFSLEPLDEDSNQISMAKSISENGSDDESYQPLSQVKIKKVEDEDDNSKGNKGVSKPKAKKSLFDMNVAGALDRNKISDREAVKTNYSNCRCTWA